MLRFFDLHEVVVHKPDGPVAGGDQHDNPDIEVVEVAPQEGRQQGRKEDQQPSHGRRSGFLAMGLGAFLTNVLSHLQLAQFADDPGS